MGKKIAIIGAGNGGQTFAGFLSLYGNEIKIYDYDQKVVDTLNELGGVTVEGQADKTGFGRIELASTDISKVLEGAEVVLVVLPSTYHDAMAEKMAPYLKDGQAILIDPAAPLGIVSFENRLRASGCKADLLLACTATLLFATRLVKTGQVKVSGQKNMVGAAAYPSSRNEEAEKAFACIPSLEFSGDIIRAGLDNLNWEVHPGPTIMNSGRIEAGIAFEYYLDLTPYQAKLIEKLDLERLALGRAYGLELRPFVQEFQYLYPQAKGDTVLEVLNGNPGYKGIKGPKSMEVRYLHEDVPFALVAMQSLGRIAGLPTPGIDAVIGMARMLIDGLAEGRTIANLGLEGLNKEDFIKRCRC